jgi:hypothetical protein
LIALAELKSGLGSGHRSHHITAQLAMAPEAKAMAEFMQSRGLNSGLTLSWTDQDLHQGF